MGKKTHRDGATVGAFVLSFRAKSLQGVGERTPERRSKSDFLRVESCEEFDGVWRVRVGGVADAGQQTQDGRVVVGAQDCELP